MRRERDDAQLMMLAGIVLTISFILGSLTLAQVASLEREAAGQRSPAIVNEWRFLQERIRSNVVAGVTPETSNASVDTSVIPTITSTFRGIQAEKGYDLQLRRAGGTGFVANGNEASLVSGGNYNAWTKDGTVHFTHPQDPDINDGLIWQIPCPSPTGPASGCIAGVYLFVRLADGTTSVEESMLIAVNRP